MLRFIDLTDPYWTYPDEAAPICAFLSTVDDKFLRTEEGCHTFDDDFDIDRHEQADRMRALMPEGFFTPPMATQMPPQEDW
jgi:hypothetical protein